MTRLKHFFRPRTALYVVVGILALLVLIQLLATPVAGHFTRKALREMDGFSGNVSAVRASVFPPRYALDELELWDRKDKAAKEPLVKVGHLELSVNWRKLLRLAVVAKAWIYKPAVIVVQRSQAEGSPQSGEEKAAAVPDLVSQLEKMAPLKVDGIYVSDGRVVFQDQTERKNPEIRLTNIDASLENLATRAALAGGEPSRLHLTALLQKSGKLTVDAAADPFEKELSFDVAAKLLDFELLEVKDMAEAAAGMHAKAGTLDIHADVKGRSGKLTGGVKPELKGVEVATVQPGVFDKLKAWVADKGVGFISDKQDRAATVVPIRGTIENAQAQTWPTVFGVLRNAFVQGLDSGFRELPPKEAPAKEGLLEQAIQAFTGSDSPEAQPESGEEAKKAHKEVKQHKQEKAEKKAVEKAKD